jgi:RNA polymerase sigma-70 factor (ECF subfamily)
MMARSVSGALIASSASAVNGTRLAHRSAEATSVAANDGVNQLIVIDRRIGGLLAAQYRSLIAYSRRLTSNGPEAADLVQIVFVRVLSQPAPVAAVRNLSGWLRTVLFNTFVDLRRRERREIPTDSAALDRRVAAPDEETALPQVTADDVRTAVAALPAHYRAPYELFTFQQMSYARIAAVLGLSRTTVGTRINRARERLRRFILARQGG